MPMGLSILFKEEKEEWWKELLVSISGPATNFIIAFSLIPFDTITNYQTIIYSNLLIGLFNLLPIIPLDGGRILKSVLKKVYDKNLAEKYTYLFTNIILIILTFLASIGTIYFKNIAIPFMITYLWIIVIRENRMYKLKERVKSIIKQNNEEINL